MFAAPPDDAADGRDWFREQYDVSRETMGRFDRYADLLTIWQAKFNLVGKATLPDIWVRHFADSAQIARFSTAAANWIDMGSGAGFPGMVVALLRDTTVTLVDSVGKKVAFLEALRDELGVRNVRVQQARAETVEARFDVLTARACAPLIKLFDWGLPSQAVSAQWLLLKGAAAESEVADARRRFAFDFELLPSMTDPRGRIVRAVNVRAADVRGKHR